MAASPEGHVAGGLEREVNTVQTGFIIYFTFRWFIEADTVTSPESFLSDLHVEGKIVIDAFLCVQLQRCI